MHSPTAFGPECQSARKIDPRSASKIDPLLLLCSAARVILTRVVGDADCGDDWPDTARAFMEREIDQADCPRSEDLAEYGSPDFMQSENFGLDVGVTTLACLPAVALG